MPYAPGDVGLKALIEELTARYDIHQSKGCVGIAPRTTILAIFDGVETANGVTTLVGKQLSPEGLGVNAMWNDFMHIPSDEILDMPIRVSWKSPKVLPELHAKVWLRDVEDLGSFPEDFTFDARSFAISLPDKRDSPEVWHHLEMFAGGFAGWTGATKIFEKIMPIQFQTVALEIEDHIARIGALNHHAAFVKPCCMLPADIISHFDGTWMLCVDICDQSWLPCVAAWNVDLLTISFPCQPWSGAAEGPGFHDLNGQLLAHSILQARWLRPRCICLENVPGFQRHSHKHILARILLLAGYKILWERTADIKNHLGVTRPRWLALAVRIQDHFQLPIVPWPTEPRTVDHSGCVLPWTLSHDELAITPAAMSMVTDRQYLSWKMIKELANPDEILATRVYDIHDVLPTFMAMYGTQHELDGNFLQRNGLFVHFKKEDRTWPGAARYWHPLEVHLLHGMCEAGFVDHDTRFAWKVAGNLITIPQAAMALLPAIQMMTKRTCTPHEFLNKFFECRLQTHCMVVTRIPRGIFVTQDPTHVTNELLASVEQLFQLQNDGDVWLPAEGRAYFVSSKGFQVVAAGHMPRVSVPTRQVPADEPMIIHSSPEPTQKFDVLLPATVNFHHHQQHLMIGESLPRQCLQSYWYGHLEHLPSASPEAFQIISEPKHDDLRPVHFSDVTTAILHDRHLVFVPSDSDVPLCQHAFCDTLPEDLYDLFGPVHAKQKPNDHTLLLTERLTHQKYPGDVLQLFSAFPRVAMDFKWDAMTDKFCVNLQGPTEATSLIADFWNSALPPAAINTLGRKATIDHQPLGVHVVFEPLCQGAVCPPKLFAFALAIAAFRSMMDCLPAQDPTQVSIKWYGRSLWTGELDIKTNVGIILQFLLWTLYPVTHGTAARLVHRGKQLVMDAKLGEVPALRHDEVNRLHVILAMRGGGAKQQNRIMQQSSLAAILLEHGYELNWISATVEQLLERYNLAKVQHVTSQPPGAARIQAVLKLCRDMSIDIPNITKPSSRKTHEGMPWKPKRVKADDQLNPMDFQILPEFFKNQDGTQAVQLTSFQPQATGICLMLMEQAMPFLTGEKLSTDELGIIVLAQSAPQTAMTPTKVVFPSWNLDKQMVLLTGFLYQLGQRDIQIQQGDPNQVKAENCSLVALTLYRSDWSQDDWAVMVTKPIPFLRGLFERVGMDQMVLSLWGKSLRCGKSPASPAQAETVQVHCSITTAKLNKFLAKSGFNAVYATPKVPSGRLDQSYKIIWLPKDETAAPILGMKAPNCLGLVKGRSSLGLRFLEQDFDKAWQVLCPGQTKPEPIVGDLMFKADGLPFGTTMIMLQEWASKVNWTCHPIKALGPTAWLLRAGTHPPEGVLMFNSTPILLRFLQPKVQPSTPVIVGPRVTKTQSEALPPLRGDPWAGWKGTSPIPSTASAQTCRTLDGPIETRLASQDDKIQQLQTSLEKMQQSQQDANKEISQRFQHVEKLQEDNMQKVSGAIEGVRTELNKSLAQVMQQNTKVLDSRLSELKALLVQTPKRPLESHEDMQD